MSEILRKLSEQGVSIWLDDISRERLRTGNLQSLIRDRQVVGVTSNPTIFASALSKGDAYDTQLHDLKIRGVDVEEAVRAITTYDIRWAADVLRPVYDASGTVDGRVSIEVDPRLARETEKTVAEARALWWMVDRPNLFIKIPATAEGLPAITQAISEGISVNVTLIFSLERYRAVMNAWLSGLEQAKAKGLDLSAIESVASFFVSRVDGEIDKRLDKIGTPEALALKGKAALANARLAFAAFEEVVESPRWQALALAGARPQRPLWASTGTKNPDYPDTLYVDELVTSGTVNTMPEKTLEATADHGRITGDTVRPSYEDAWNTMAALKEIGIDYDDVVRFLEEDGVDKFEASWTELLATVATELKKA
ncbi:transaldolase [Streptosporangium sp. NBC_01755]|uniref:transaldolase n=1 Tax=unclassified Streptosporangium TaxID=2632669 RepID=UPI002DD8D7C4|nr:MULTISPECIES: transaldolase [unclassified Streptosporangium]WSA29192.1 transaldolase [Streptosporangium sp. NBC_01810]WSC99363.1 transaldolase [Streptosporangium sp. NBC_01755]